MHTINNTQNIKEGYKTRNKVTLNFLSLQIILATSMSVCLILLCMPIPSIKYNILPIADAQ